MTTTWLGIDGTYTKSQALVNDLKTTLPDKITARFSNTGWIDTDYPNLLTELDTIYNKMKDN